MSDRLRSGLLVCVLSLLLPSGLTLRPAAAQSPPDVGPAVPSGPASTRPATPAVGPPRRTDPQHLTHPCGGMFPEPPFIGVSPLAIAAVPGMCASGYGDIGVWQAGGHDYVVLSGFALRMFHIFQVDDPYNPVTLRTQPFPAGGTASTSVFPFPQNGNHYLSVTMRGAGTGCGFFVYNVNDPANPVFVGRKVGTDWCTVHEHFVSTDANGNADYAWLAMSGETGSGYKVVVVNIQNLTNMVETGRYQRPDASGTIFVHDVTVIGERVFLAHWGGGVLIHDKQTLANNVNPTPLNPIDSIRPAGFNVHQAWPTSDGNHLFIQDEFINNASTEKIRLYNIANLSAPFYETGIIGSGTAATNRAHNMRIQNIAPGLDRLYAAWYQAGTRGFEVNTAGPSPIITETIQHQLKQTTNGQFGNVWGVDYLPCVPDARNPTHPTTCIYSGDMTYGLVVDALGYDQLVDPYPPESQITDPVQGQAIAGCTYLIQGVAHDYYSGVAQVEVSTDNGVNWLPVPGTTTWSYPWTIPGDGAYMLQSRARDAAGNYETPTTSVTVSVSSCAGPTATPGPATATSTAVPPTGTPGLPTATPTPIAPTPCPVQFQDVPVGSTFYDTIRCLACRGIVGGYPCGGPGEPCPGPYYRPNNNVTRGQVSKIVAESAGFADPVPSTQQTFADVAPGSTFALWVERLASRGIISGYPCGGPGEPCGGPTNRPYFRPNTPVTRGQLSKIVSGAAGWTETPTGQTFADLPPGSPFYLFVQRIAGRGIISGYPCGGAGEPCVAPSNRPYFRPGSTATRGQTAKIGADAFYPNCQTPARR